MNNLKEKINASLMFTSYFDTLGFNNGKWEFNFDYNKKIEKEETASLFWLFIVHEYYALGGSNYDISKKIASDDTILTIAIAEGCINGGKNIDYIKSFKKYFKILDQEKRFAGVNTILTLKELFKHNNIDKIKYNSSMGGNGAAIRTSSIGLIYYSEKDIDKLILQSIESSRMTHNYPLGFLAGFVTALFTSYCIRQINPIIWCDKLIKLYESGKIDDILKKTSIFKKYKNDKNEFWDIWYEYREKKINSINKNKGIYYNALDRTKDLKKYTLSLKKSNDYSKWGASGVGALILAYDAILTSSYKENNKIKFNIDSLIFFSVLHFGDNDSTGSIAGSWFGAFNGYHNFDKNKMKNLEFYEKLNDISDKIFKIIK